MPPMNRFDNLWFGINLVGVAILTLSALYSPLNNDANKLKVVDWSVPLISWIGIYLFCRRSLYRAQTTMVLGVMYVLAFVILMFPPAVASTAALQWYYPLIIGLLYCLFLTD